MDAAYGLVVEARRPVELQSEASFSRLHHALLRTLAVLEQARDQLSDDSAGRLEVTLCCALGFIDFRLPVLDWRAEHSALG